MAVYDIRSHMKLEPDCVSYTTSGLLNIFYCLPGGKLVALNLWRGSNPELETMTVPNSRTREDRFALLKDVCARSHSRVQDVLKRAEEEGATPWSKGRIVLVGDAAFCLTLLSIQGAGMTLVASEILGRALKETSDVAQALSNYEKKMRPAITRLQARVRGLAAMYVPKGAGAFYSRNLFLRLIPRSLLIRFHRTALANGILITE
ncbi:hypothetical protein BDW75DRAFT_238135 [Aspergillus navahoensis]